MRAQAGTILMVLSHFVLGLASHCKNLDTSMVMKPKRILLGSNPLSDAPCQIGVLGKPLLKCLNRD